MNRALKLLTLKDKGITGNEKINIYMDLNDELD